MNARPMNSPEAWPAIHREPALVRNQVASNLRTAIIEGRLKPGDRLVERSLCEQLGVSRPLLREAVRQLEAERLVESVPNRGPVVRTLSYAETADLIEICARLEGLCARFFVLRGTAEDLDQFRLALIEFEKQIGKIPIVDPDGDIIAFRHAKATYYEAFLRGCHSELIADAVHRYNAQLSQHWASSITHPERSEQGRKELRQILRAIEDRDAAAAAAAAENYVYHAGQFILDYALGGPPPAA